MPNCYITNSHLLKKPNYRYYFKPFNKIDAFIMDFRDKEELQNILIRCPNYFELLETDTFQTYTVFCNKMPLLIIFWSDDLYGNREICMLAGKDIKYNFNHKVLGVIKDILDIALCGCKRLQSLISEDKTNKRFIEFLGFKQEFKMPCYGFNNEPMFMYSIINPYLK